MAVGFRQRLVALTSPMARRKELSLSCSAGLAGRFHPVEVAGLHDSVNALIRWIHGPAPAQAACTAWIGAGMDRLSNLLSGLTDLLRHQDLERLQCQTASSWTERLLGDLILLADAHSCFCELLVSRKQILGEAQAAVRHHDATRLAAALRGGRRYDHGFSHLVSKMCGLSHRSYSSAKATSDSGDAALEEAVTAAMCAAAAASATIFAGLASASATSALRALTVRTAASPVEAMQRLQRLEECVVAAADGCEHLHRALVNTMESLLNVLTPC